MWSFLDKFRTSGRKKSIAVGDDRRNRKWPIGRRAQFELLETRQLLAVIAVDRFVDERDLSIVDGDISLRDAVEQSLAGDTITFAPSLNGATIALDRTLGELGKIKGGRTH